MPLSIEQTLMLLATAPKRLVELTSELPPERLQAAPGEDEWSAIEVLTHLRSCADVWGGGIARILAEERPTIRAVSPRSWVKQAEYRRQDFRSSLRAFTEQRGDLLAILEPLPPERWACSAIVKRGRAILEWSVFDYAERLANHESIHLEQIERLVSEGF
jgi:hypothetical protein